MEFIIVALLSYLIGSIPFGLVLCKIFGYGDIRTIGSGNIGATNVLRTGNKILALATLILDSGKGALAAAISFIWFSVYPDCAIASCTDSIPPICGTCLNYDLSFYLLVSGFFAIIGHSYPLWLKFKGGKGVATTLGTLLAAVPLAGVAACVTWLVVAVIFKISSLSALVALAVVPVVVFFIYGSAPSAIAFLITLLVFWKHRENIKRLIKGEEPKINFKKKRETP